MDTHLVEPNVAPALHPHRRVHRLPALPRRRVPLQGGDRDRGGPVGDFGLGRLLLLVFVGVDVEVCVECVCIYGFVCDVR